MLPDQVSNPGPLIYESGALPIALRGPAISVFSYLIIILSSQTFSMRFLRFSIAKYTLPNHERAK